MKTLIVDTNVILVANGQHDNTSPECVRNCAKNLDDVMRSNRIALDSGYRILKEYQNKTNPRKAKGPGDAFVKWALQVCGDQNRCDQVDIHDEYERGFKEFPSDPNLQDFDLSDRKFIAVAITHGHNPTVLQATDSKWVKYESALKSNKISVEFLCHKDIHRFHRRKASK